MSFDDLPDDWPDRPVDDPQLVADVLDLVVSVADRERGGLAVLMCDEDARLVQPVVVSDLDPEMTDEDRCRSVAVFAEAIGELRGSLLLALAREDGLSITEDDRRWATAARRACGAQVRFLGLHVITVGGSREVAQGDVAA